MLFFRSSRVIADLLFSNKTTVIVNSFSIKIFKSSDKTNLKSLSKHFKPMDKFVVLPSPFKSGSDKKDYRVIQLKNGLKACLISDTPNIVEVSSRSKSNSICSTESSSEDDDDEFIGCSSEQSNEEVEEQVESEEEGSRPKHIMTEQKMAAAGLCVGVGSFSDPKDVPGMAHFLEHMVFMGSEKFPEENDFDSFLKKSGGNNNAATDTETTCFYFECLEKHLFTALDKFAQFFIAPLMKKGAMTREREAIESEFQMALPSDSSKREQLLFTFAKPDSPVNSFSWGNLITLRDNVSDDELYKGVHSFRKRHYSAHRMTLAIQARLPLDTLQEYVLQCFENVPNNNLPPNDFSHFKGNVFDTPEFYKMYYVKPSKEMCEVHLTWSLPPLFDQYKCNPIRYLSHLLGDEGTGSIAAYLRKKLWAVTVNCGNSGSGDELNSMYTLFTVSMVLTDQGLEHLFEVIETVFSYINLLKKIGPQEQIYNEIKTVGDIGFKFAREETAEDMVEDLCEIMHFFPPEDYLTSDDLLYQYEPQIIENITDLLTPNKVNIMVMTSKDLPIGINYDKKEKWFGTKYIDLVIPDDILKKWSEVLPYTQLAIPMPNPYLTEDFSLLPEIKNNPDYPEKILSTPLLELWYRKDQKFKLPLGYYKLYLISPLPMDSAKNGVLLDMMMNIFTFALAEKLYPASNAGLNYNCLIYEKGLSIKVYGYNEKLPLIINVISQHLLNLNDYFDEELFKTIKETLLKNYYNKLLKPSSLAKDIRLQLLVDKYWPPAEKFVALREVTFDEMTKFTKKYVETLYMKGLVQGNVSQEIVIETVNKLVKDLNYTQLGAEDYPKFRVFQVPHGEKCVRVEGFNKRDTNSIVTNYYQCAPFSFETCAMIDLIMMIIEEPLFDTLRTKEQLGYHVYCASRDTFGILGYTLTVNAQATKFSTSFIDNRIEEFLKYTQRLLRNTSEKELDEIKEDLIKAKECVDVHLKEEVSRNWSEIINDEYIFDRQKREIEAIKKITIKEVRHWWSSHNRFGTKSDYRKISIQVVGHDTISSSLSNDKEEEEEDEEDIASPIISATLIGNEDVSKRENKDKDYFIPSIKQFKDTSYLYPPAQILK